MCEVGWSSGGEAKCVCVCGCHCGAVRSVCVCVWGDLCLQNC